MVVLTHPDTVRPILSNKDSYVKVQTQTLPLRTDTALRTDICIYD